MSFLLNSFKRTVRCAVTSGGSILLLLPLLTLLRILLAQRSNLLIEFFEGKVLEYALQTRR